MFSLFKRQQRAKLRKMRKQTAGFRRATLERLNADCCIATGPVVMLTTDEDGVREIDPGGQASGKEQRDG